MTSEQTYEYYADVLEDGHLSTPEDLKDKLKTYSKVKIIVMFDDDDDALWNNMTLSEFLKGYSAKDAIYDSL